VTYARSAEDFTSKIFFPARRNMNVGTPLFQQISLMDNGALDKIEETPVPLLLDKGS
jgi:hypothetical protein